MVNRGNLSITRGAEGVLLLEIGGDWILGGELPQAGEVERALESGAPVRTVTIMARDLGQWDSSLLTLLVRVTAFCERMGIAIDRKGLPEGVQRLVALATAVPERKGARREAERVPFLERVGDSSVRAWDTTRNGVEFLGEATIAFVRMFAGRASFRFSDLLLVIQETGAKALPIVSLISLLVGLILAFVGAIQLRTFGAQVYVADMVGIAMVRVMGAIMTGIIMAGRTGASFAAQLGTMQTNEEIDALSTLGISPMEFLVLPRMLALMVMMPLLCLYADLMGILGGFIVGVGMLDITPMQYYTHTRDAVSLTNLWIGLIHSAVFGVLVALAGCLKGIQCGRSASAVGDATTSAVVTGIISIILATAVITVICNVLGV